MVGSVIPSFGGHVTMEIWDREIEFSLSVTPERGFVHV